MSTETAELKIDVYAQDAAAFALYKHEVPESVPEAGECRARFVSRHHRLSKH